MAVALLTLELYLPMNQSLNDKRKVVKPVIARLRRDFNISVCEADAQDEPTRFDARPVEIGRARVGTIGVHREYDNVCGRGGSSRGSEGDHDRPLSSVS